MTGTDASLFAALGDRAQIMEVSGGTVRPADPARIEGASPETSP